MAMPGPVPIGVTAHTVLMASHLSPGPLFSFPFHVGYRVRCLASFMSGSIVPIVLGQADVFSFDIAPVMSRSATDSKVH